MDHHRMKALRLEQPGQVETGRLVSAEVNVPRPGPGQILLRVAVCGVCHTDLHTVEGDLELPRLPIIPGHQVVARVEETGIRSERFSVGERVGVGWLNWTCGRCYYCTSGLENLCAQAKFTGLHADGGYAQFLVVDEAFAFSIPESFSDDQAAPLLCAGIVGYRSLRLSGVQHGGNLGLYGFGGSAHLVIQVARHWDCQVFVFTRGEHHRQLAHKLGAAWTGGAEDKPPVELDGGIIFAPAGWIVPLALSHIRPGATVAINAIHMSPVPEMPYELLYGERNLRSVTNFTRQDAQDFLRLAAEIPIHSEVEVYSLAEANDVLILLKKRELMASAVLQIP